jgi:hypothetical protein
MAALSGSAGKFRRRVKRNCDDKEPCISKKVINHDWESEKEAAIFWNFVVRDILRW